MLHPSRKLPKPGDVFAIGLPDDTYLFGRVVSTTARWSVGDEFGGAKLIYVFEHRSPTKSIPDRMNLQTDRLLIAPMLINRQSWLRGYFETLGNLPFENGEVFAAHCFELNFGSLIPARRPRWFDEHANELPQAVPPVGMWAMGSYGAIAYEVGTAIGMPLYIDD